MPLRVQTGFIFALIFTFAMGLHFMLVDRRLNTAFPTLFKTKSRMVLLAALFLGWFLTDVTNPINVVLASFMIAFLSGSVLYEVFREELPVVNGVKFLSFSMGLISVAALLVWQIILEV